jgi:long-chain acyl-CoA synthetase
VKDYVSDAISLYGDNDAFVLKTEKGGKAYYRHITYHAFWEEIRSFGAGLCAMGLQGKRVAIIGFNSYEWILTYLAVLCGVGVIVPLDKELTEPEVLLSLERAKCDAVVFDAKHEELFLRLKEGNDLGISHFISTKKIAEGVQSIGEVKELGALALKNGSEFDSYDPDPDALASIIFTSGTTSLSKAVMLSNRNIATNLFDLLSVEYIYPEDRNLVFLPLHHTFGSVGLTYFLASGATNMFCDGLRHVQKNLQEYKITTFVCVPLLLEVMYRNIWRGVEKKKLKGVVKFLLLISRGLKKIGIDPEAFAAKLPAKYTWNGSNFVAL